jgi:hypothetical protein
MSESTPHDHQLKPANHPADVDVANDNGATAEGISDPGKAASPKKYVKPSIARHGNLRMMTQLE